MIHFAKDEHHDAGWLNRTIKECLEPNDFTPAQEALIKKLVIEIAAGYQHTISRMDWGPGWD